MITHNLILDDWTDTEIICSFAIGSDCNSNIFHVVPSIHDPSLNTMKSNDTALSSLTFFQQIATNGIYRSIEHRATVNREKERLSLATFLSAKLDGELGPAPSLITPESPALFRRVSVADFFRGYFSRELHGKSYVDVMRIRSEEGRYNWATANSDTKHIFQSCIQMNFKLELTTTHKSGSWNTTREV